MCRTIIIILTYLYENNYTEVLFYSGVKTCYTRERLPQYCYNIIRMYCMIMMTGNNV